MSKVSQKQYDRVLRQVEEKTCFRFSAGVEDNSAFMVPVNSEGVVIGECMQFTWKQLKGMSELPSMPV